MAPLREVQDLESLKQRELAVFPLGTQDSLLPEGPSLHTLDTWLLATELFTVNPNELTFLCGCQEARLQARGKG